MAIHHFQPTEYYNTFGSHQPALAIGDGDTVIAQTIDAHGFDRQGRQPGQRPNPMTGPFFIAGAEVGGVLSVRINRIAMTRPDGWTFDRLSCNVVDPSAAARFAPREKCQWIIDIAAGRARLRQPPKSLRNWSVPVTPMIGCLGVAPAMGQAISTATSGSYGGNMDYRGMTAGVDIMFPVAVPGALFFLGDVHASQGDGEIAGTGIETAAEVEFSVHVMKSRAINWPRGRTAAEFFTIGNARPLDQALQHATTEMLNWLLESHGLDDISASHVMGQAVRYDIANVFNPAYSVVCRMPQSALVETLQG